MLNVRLEAFIYFLILCMKLLQKIRYFAEKKAKVKNKEGVDSKSFSTAFYLCFFLKKNVELVLNDFSYQC